MRSLYGIVFAFGCAGGAWAADGDRGALITEVLAIGHDGSGHEAAQAALTQLLAQDAGALPEILTALNDANPLAANWLRGAFETIAARTLSEGGELPQRELLVFFEDQTNHPRARRLAYEWIVRVDPAAADAIVPNSLTDPSAEMRRDAVSRLLETARQAEADGRNADAVEVYRTALQGASEAEQVEPILKSLEQLGEPVNRIAQYGMLTQWQVIGPFDNKGSASFDVAYPPESEVDLEATYDGQTGPVSWQRLSAAGADGTFNLAELTAPHKGAIDYVTTEFYSAEDLPVEFRLATGNAWKLWVNGELVFAREEYHRGMWFDQYRMPGQLRQGANRILIKVCQNEQEEPWAQDWSFQFRICDQYGRALSPESGTP
jgi:hypothetical protein